MIKQKIKAFQGYLLFRHQWTFPRSGGCFEVQMEFWLWKWIGGDGEIADSDPLKDRTGLCPGQNPGEISKSKMERCTTGHEYQVVAPRTIFCPSADPHRLCLHCVCRGEQALGSRPIGHVALGTVLLPVNKTQGNGFLGGVDIGYRPHS